MNGSLSVNLRKKRLEYRKTQEEMAKILHVKRATYGEYERGKISPPLEKVEMMAEFFQTSIDSLIGIDMNSRIKHTVLTNSEELADRYLRWQNAVGYGDFTDEEVDEIINYAKYIIWRRGEKNVRNR